MLVLYIIGASLSEPYINKVYMKFLCLSVGTFMNDKLQMYFEFTANHRLLFHFSVARQASSQKLCWGVLVEKSGPQGTTAKHNLQVHDGVCTAHFHEGSKMQVIPYTK